eukprot:CAMPEP_0114506514 /NCGR_PEP_ID=MMETSP0109-20121206/11466_1 /TAXON_ID=29199 /ORGANISM="Chlorarachnion reptans, Strain CCCM449" /LENGTH=237 /DNA_ID=CAMNT_0001685103 /DNA_START=14 /DNA_END=724 /DNA_ORIENTATION=-
MARQMRGIEGMIEEDSQWNGEFTEDRGKTVWEDGLIAHGLKEAPPETGSEKSDKIILQKFLERQEKEKKGAHQRRRETVDNNRNEAGEDESDDEDEDDDDFFRQYRALRIGELKNSARRQRNGKHEEANSSGTQSIETILAQEFKERVVENSFDSPVAMLIYNGSKESDEMARLVRPLAFKFPTVTFLKMEASEMLRGVPKEDCPILMLYKKGKVIGQFAKLKSFHGPKTTTDVIEW